MKKVISVIIIVLMVFMLTSCKHDQMNVISEKVTFEDTNFNFSWSEKDEIYLSNDLSNRGTKGLLIPTENNEYLYSYDEFGSFRDNKILYVNKNGEITWQEYGRLNEAYTINHTTFLSYSKLFDKYIVKFKNGVFVEEIGIYNDLYFKKIGDNLLIIHDNTLEFFDENANLKFNLELDSSFGNYKLYEFNNNYIIIGEGREQFLFQVFNHTGKILWQKKASNIRDYRIFNDKYVLLYKYNIENGYKLTLISLDSKGNEKYLIGPSNKIVYTPNIYYQNNLYIYTENKLIKFDHKLNKKGEVPFDEIRNVNFDNQVIRVISNRDQAKVDIYNLNLELIMNYQTDQSDIKAEFFNNKLFLGTDNKFQIINKGGEVTFETDRFSSISSIKINNDAILLNNFSYLNKIDENGNEIWQNQYAGGFYFTYDHDKLVLMGAKKIEVVDNKTEVISKYTVIGLDKRCLNDTIPTVTFYVLDVDHHIKKVTVSSPAMEYYYHI